MGEWGAAMRQTCRTAIHMRSRVVSFTKFSTSKGLAARAFEKWSHRVHLEDVLLRTHNSCSSGGFLADAGVVIVGNESRLRRYHSVAPPNDEHRSRDACRN